MRRRAVDKILLCTEFSSFRVLLRDIRLLLALFAVYLSLLPLQGKPVLRLDFIVRFFPALLPGRRWCGLFYQSDRDIPGDSL